VCTAQQQAERLRAAVMRLSEERDQERGRAEAAAEELLRVRNMAGAVAEQLSKAQEPLMAPGSKVRFFDHASA
jgi:hypothetical protein